MGSHTAFTFILQYFEERSRLFSLNIDRLEFNLIFFAKARSIIWWSQLHSLKIGTRTEPCRTKIFTGVFFYKLPGLPLDGQDILHLVVTAVEAFSRVELCCHSVDRSPPGSSVHGISQQEY